MSSPASISTISQLDHLVIMAATLEEGVQWCESTLGVTPAAGGRHAFMGTHNRLLRTSSDAFAASYLEIIAIDPEGAPPVAPFDKRWFDMDTASLRASVTQHGPQLIHWVASVPDVAERCTALAALGIERGPVLTASRPTPNGLLQWQITVRDDGLRLMDGIAPSAMLCIFCSMARRRDWLIRAAATQRALPSGKRSDLGWPPQPDLARGRSRPRSR